MTEFRLSNEDVKKQWWDQGPATTVSYAAPVVQLEEEYDDDDEDEE